MPASAASNLARKTARASCTSVLRSTSERLGSSSVCTSRKVSATCSLVQMEGRRDDVARRLVAELDDVFAEIGFDRHDAVGFEKGIELDLLRHHGFALGDGLRAGLAQDGEDGLARFFGVARPMHLCRRAR